MPVHHYNQGKLAFRLRYDDTTCKCSLCKAMNARRRRVCWSCHATLRNRPKRKKTTDLEKRRKAAAARASKHLRQIKLSMTHYTKALKEERRLALKMAEAKTTTPGARRALDLEE